jgi:hypothetical protein
MSRSTTRPLCRPPTLARRLRSPPHEQSRHNRPVGIIAEIGDVTRFPGPRQLACWAGLTPRHRESDTTVHRGPITKQGSRLVRWAAIEAVQRTPSSAGWLVATRAGLTHRRGRNIATTAVARRLLALVFYGLRDGHIRALDTGQRRRTSTEAA